MSRGHHLKHLGETTPNKRSEGPLALELGYRWPVLKSTGRLLKDVPDNSRFLFLIYIKSVNLAGLAPTNHLAKAKAGAHFWVGGSHSSDSLQVWISSLGNRPVSSWRSTSFSGHGLGTLGTIPNPRVSSGCLHPPLGPNPLGFSAAQTRFLKTQSQLARKRRTERQSCSPRPRW